MSGTNSSLQLRPSEVQREVIETQREMHSKKLDDNYLDSGLSKPCDTEGALVTGVGTILTVRQQQRDDDAGTELARCEIGLYKTPP